MNKALFYTKILSWCLEVHQNHKKGHSLIIGVNGPQGSGKTTLTKKLVSLLRELSVPSLSISIDDFYLNRAEQIQLARRHSDNPYLQERGYPGTHDVDLGFQVLQDLRNIGQYKSVHIPSYEKSLFGGKGDRNSPELWPEYSEAEIIFLEGWMLGFEPVTSSSIKDPHLKTINSYLAAYKKWHSMIEAFIQLDPLEIDYAIDWRIEAEEKMKAQGKSGMSLEEVRSYIKNFIPAYEMYLPGLRQNKIISGPGIRVKIGKDRLPISYEAC